MILSSITSNIGELSCVCTGFAGAAMGLPIPITAVQILSIDLIGEMLPLMALTFDPAEPAVMKHPPRKQAAAFLGIVLIQYMNILSRRSAGSVFGRYLFANRPLLASLVLSFAIVATITSNGSVGAWFGFEALRPQDWTWPVAAAAIFLASFEVKKWLAARRESR